jgi:RimJ/RimL family protein N-acetyltransferase
MSGTPQFVLNGSPFPRALTFTGRFITLTPLEIERDAAELLALSHADEDALKLWRYLPVGPFPSLEAYTAFLGECQSKPDLIVFTVRDAATGKALGSISLMSIRAEHGVAELGNIWYVPQAQRTKTNTESCYLLLRYCFEELGYRRMEWKCNSRNEPSHNAALRLGFTFEGIFRQHMVVKGESRDTTWFSLLDQEWKTIGSAMQHWLYKDDSISLAQLIQKKHPGVS